MKMLQLRIAAVILFSSFAASSGSFASTPGDTKLVENVDDETVEPLGPKELNDVVESLEPPVYTIDEPNPAWTRADCVKSWKMNMSGCNTSPPNLRPACWAAASALFAACAAAAQG